MKTQKITMVAAFLILTLTACKKENTTETIVDAQGTTQVVDMHNAQNALDWQGTYAGTLPCASCPGIETHIVLMDDGTFVKSMHYMGEGDDVKYVKGDFTWFEDGTIIALDGNQYKVAENQMIMLDEDGNEVSGDMAALYVLHKTQLTEVPDANLGTHVLGFTADDGSDVQIVLDNDSDVPTATVTKGEFESTLEQTEAWAKGAAYEKSGVKLHMQGDKGKLEMDGKEIVLTAK